MKKNRKIILCVLLGFNIAFFGGYMFMNSSSEEVHSREDIERFYDLGNYAEIKDSIPENPNDPTMMNIKTITMIKNVNLAGAKEFIESQTETTGVMKDLYPFLVFIENEQWDEALTVVESMSPRGPSENSLVLSLRGYVLIQQNKLKPAQKLINQIQIDDPLSPLQKYLTALVAFNAKKRAKTIEILEEMELLGGEMSNDVRILKGKSLYTMNRYEEAVEVFSSIDPLSPQRNENIILIGRSYFETERYAEANQILESIKDPSLQTTKLRRQGRVAYAQGDQDAALTYWNQLLIQESDDFDLRIEMAPLVHIASTDEERDIFLLQITEAAGDNLGRQIQVLRMLRGINEIDEAVILAKKYDNFLTDEGIQKLNKPQNNLRQEMQIVYTMQLLKSNIGATPSSDMLSLIDNTKPLTDGATLIFAGLRYSVGEESVALNRVQAVNDKRGTDELLIVVGLYYAMSNDFQNASTIIENISNELDRDRLERFIAFRGYDISKIKTLQNTIDPNGEISDYEAAFTSHFKMWYPKMIQYFSAR